MDDGRLSIVAPQPEFAQVVEPVDAAGKHGQPTGLRLEFDQAGDAADDVRQDGLRALADVEVAQPRLSSQRVQDLRHLVVVQVGAATEISQVAQLGGHRGEVVMAEVQGGSAAVGGRSCPRGSAPGVRCPVDRLRFPSLPLTPEVQRMRRGVFPSSMCRCQAKNRSRCRTTTSGGAVTLAGRVRRSSG